MRLAMALSIFLSLATLVGCSSANETNKGSAAGSNGNNEAEQQKVLTDFLTRVGTVSDIQQTIDEDSKLVFQPLGKIIGGDLKIALGKSPSHATVSVEGSNLTYVPKPNFFGSDSFVLELSIPSGNFIKSLTVNLKVLPVADLPLAKDTSEPVAGDSITSKLSASDPDGGVISYEIVDTPNVGDINLDPKTGNYSYSVDATKFAAKTVENGFKPKFDKFTYVAIDDDNNRSEKATVMLNFGSRNTKPVVYPRTYLYDSNSKSLTSSVSAYDPDGQPLQVRVVRVWGPSSPWYIQDLAQVNTGSENAYDFNFKAPSRGGTWYASVIANDGQEDSDEATLSFYSIERNDSPEFTWKNDSFSLSENSRIDFAGIPADVEVEVMFQPSRGQVSTVGQSVRYSTFASYNGSDQFIIRLAKTAYIAGEKTKIVSPNYLFNVEVTKSTEPARPLNLVYNIENFAKTLIELKSSNDNANFTYELTSVPSQCTVTGFNKNQGLFYVEPTKFDSRNINITYRLSSGSTSGNVYINPNATNDPPTAEDMALNIEEDASPVAITPIISDPDSQKLTLYATSQPTKGALTSAVTASGTFIYRPNTNANGTDTFSYKAVDEQGASSVIKTVTINIKPINDMPIWQTSTVFTMNEEDTLTITPTITDPEGNTAIFKIIGNPTNGTVSENSGKFEYKPRTNFYGSDSFKVLLSDNGASDGQLATTVEVKITIRNVPDEILAQTINIVTKGQDKVRFTVAATDPDDLTGTRPLIFFLTLRPARGSSVLSYNNNTPTFDYTPSQTNNLEDRFKVSISGGLAGITKTIDVLVNNNNVNDPPTIAGETSFTLDEDRWKSTCIKYNDPENNLISAKITEFPKNGVLTTEIYQDDPRSVCNSSIRISYTPRPNFNGNDGAKIAISDGQNTSEFPVNFAIQAVDDIPTFSLEKLTFSTNGSNSGSFKIPYDDPDNDPSRIYFQGIKPPSVWDWYCTNFGNQFSIQGDTLNYTKPVDLPSFSGLDIFILAVTDKGPWPTSCKDKPSWALGSWDDWASYKYPGQRPPTIYGYVKSSGVPIKLISEGGNDWFDSHTCASDGTRLKCWGSNKYGMLGLGDSQGRGGSLWGLGSALPLVDYGTAKKIKQILAVGLRTCVLFEDGTLKCWGMWVGDQPNEMGANLKEAVFPYGLTLKSVTTAGYQNYAFCGIFSDDTVRCWGTSNYDGELGTGVIGGNNYSQLLPVNLGSNFKPQKVVSTANGFCALSTSSQVKCWGEAGPYLGQGTGKNLTVGNKPDQMGESLPPINFGTTLNIVDIAASYDTWYGRVCVIFENGQAKCWGAGWYEKNLDAPQDYVERGTSLKITQMSLSSTHTCALFEDGSAKCWGDRSGQSWGKTSTTSPGSSNYYVDQLPKDAPFIKFGSRKITRIEAKYDYTCALLDDGTMRCFGQNGSGALGGTTSTTGPIDQLPEVPL